MPTTRLAHFQVCMFVSSLLLFVFCTAPAQHVTGDLQLSIVDSLGQPVLGVNVVVSGTHVQGVRGGATDILGRCTLLALPPGTVSLRISHAAYQSVIVNDVLIQLGKTTDVGEIRLRQRTLDMPELVISGLRPGIDPRSTAYGSTFVLRILRISRWIETIRV